MTDKEPEANMDDVIRAIKQSFIDKFIEAWGHGPEKETGTGVGPEEWQDFLNDHFRTDAQSDAIERIIDELREVSDTEGQDDYEGLWVYTWDKDFVKRLGFKPAAAAAEGEGEGEGDGRDEQAPKRRRVEDDDDDEEEEEEV